ncbi:PepSY domain-containing protein [uncultured Croceicoccus sp.]|uniref:PepSY domain-containing protein n=1 Tax=uncultured Croceicoccus sp. TaxID=1295329 RepID=UPI00262AEC6F|nr:PepSY domain-containing protein [uncultured Croceicoccus sp.]
MTIRTSHRPRFAMRAPVAAVLVAVSCLSLAVPAHAEQGKRDGQGEARRELRAGNVHTLREIESRVLPRMKGMDYLGMDEFSANTYRLKFIRNGRVVFVDVDARTGNIVNIMR